MVPKMIFIVPYRNREQHKTFFSKYMEFIMEDVSRQTEDTGFTRRDMAKSYLIISCPANRVKYEVVL